MIYQIYVRSFQDSNDDGIGDLSGIVSRLPYVADLGVDAIWITPFYASPMKDGGYDVSDYRAVDPVFGSLTDFDELVAVTHRSGLRVMIDLVLSHTSDAHPWFVESRSSRTNANSDWYVWADPKADGVPPNNWLSVFGGSAWQWDDVRSQYYLHNFLASQPDLNFHSSEVRDEVCAVARYWLDRGVDGFRLDTVNFYFCDERLRDNPPLDPEYRNSVIAPSVNPYNNQDHIYDKNRPENLTFLRRFRALLDEYSATAVGEVGDARRGLEIVSQYTAGSHLLHMCYGFDLLSANRLDGPTLAGIMNRFEDAAHDGWPCWAMSNHDVVRQATRLGLNDPGKRAVALLFLFLRGTLCIYQGEELGLTEAKIDFAQLRDPYGKQFWPEFKGRDGCRTPMVWTANHAYGGFSNTAPFLPVPKEHLVKAVSVQQSDPTSTLNSYRKPIALRRSHPALRCGTIEFHSADGPAIVLTRTNGVETILLAVNLGDAAQTRSVPSGDWRQFQGLGFEAEYGDGTVRLPPYQAFVAAQM